MVPALESKAEFETTVDLSRRELDLEPRTKTCTHPLARFSPLFFWCNHETPSFPATIVLASAVFADSRRSRALAADLGLSRR